MVLGLLTVLAGACQSTTEPTVDAPGAGRAVGISIDNAGTIWMTSPRKGAYSSTDGGHHWVRLAHTFGASALTFVPRGTLLASGRQLMLAPIAEPEPVLMKEAPVKFVAMTTPYPPTRRVYALDASGHPWLSVNQGWSWQRLAAAGLPASGRAIDAIRNKPIYSDVIYVGVAGKGIWVSHDFGARFHRLAGAPAATAISTTTDDPMRILVANTNGIYLSTDAGASWRKVSAAEVVSLALDFRNAGNAVALTSEGDLLRSVDGGATWSRGS